jgi:hypothetical protein
MRRHIVSITATVSALVAVALLAASPSSAATLRTIDFVNASTGWAAGDGTIVATTDGGRTWHSQYSGRVQFTSLSFTPSGYGWAAGVDPVAGSGVLMGTSDGGRHWKKLPEPRNAIRTLSFADPSLGLAVAGGSPMSPGSATERSTPFFGGRLAVGTNQGATWALEEHPLLIDSACTAGAYASFVAYQAAVWISTSFGTDWQRALDAPVDTHITWYSTVRCNRGSVWALFATDDRGMQQRSYLLERSDQTGTTWNPVLENKRTPDAYPHVNVSDGPGPAPGDFSVPDADTAFVLGICLPCGGSGTVTIVSTTDAGSHWSSVATIPVISAASPPAVSFVDQNHGWIAGSNAGKGVILATGDGGKSWNQVYSK